MDLVITINMDNAAFEDGRDAELNRIFRAIREEISMGEQRGPCMDGNGNRVGDWEIES